MSDNSDSIRKALGLQKQDGAFRRPFNSEIKSLVVKRFSSMSREDLRKKMRDAADAMHISKVWLVIESYYESQSDTSYKVSFVCSSLEQAKHRLAEVSSHFTDRADAIVTDLRMSGQVNHTFFDNYIEEHAVEGRS